jgi:hypothetical protein
MIMNVVNQHEEVLRSVRKKAEELGSLGRELEASAQARGVVRDVAKGESSGMYRQPYTSTPDFIGERWSA